MSDYMFMLESHLSSDQSRVVNEFQTAANQANINIFLTGGAMRDMLGGFPILEIDFTVEGNAIKLAQTVAKKTGAKNIWRPTRTASWCRCNFRAACTPPSEWRARKGIRSLATSPLLNPPRMHEDLRGRDFTINSIALSLNPASRGLLLDPNNGVGDLERKELRAVSNYTLYDDPVRLLRLLRFKVRLGFTIEERTKMQYDNAREAQLETRIPQPALLDELRHTANEPNCRRRGASARRRETAASLLQSFGGRQAESAGIVEAPEGQTDGSVRRGHAPRKHGPVPVFPGRETGGERAGRVGQAGGPQ